ncbi:winged helix-turn-helix domain-containing protein [Magnetococcales bacterium HHB-1]
MKILYALSEKSPNNTFNVREYIIETYKNIGIVADLARSVDDIEHLCQEKIPYAGIVFDHIAPAEVAHLLQLHNNHSIPVCAVNNQNINQQEREAFHKAGVHNVIEQVGPAVVAVTMQQLIGMRHHEQTPRSSRLSKGITVNWELGTISNESNQVTLTAKELEIFRELYYNQGRVLSQSQLLERLYPDAYAARDRTLLNVFICKIRKKLEQFGARKYLKTINRRGFVWQESDSNSH